MKYPITLITSNEIKKKLSMIQWEHFELDKTDISNKFFVTKKTSSSRIITLITSLVSLQLENISRPLQSIINHVNDKLQYRIFIWIWNTTNILQ